MECDVQICATRNIHGWTEEKLKKIAKSWENTPNHYNKLDLRAFLQDKEITPVEMEDAQTEKETDRKKSEDLSEISDEESDKKSDISNPDEVRFLAKKRTNFAVNID